MQTFLTSFVLISLLILLALTPLYQLVLREVFATSPSFPSQELLDPPYDWKNMNGYMGSTGHRSTDIEAVSYSSNGSLLNATIWLSASFEEKPIGYMPSYGLLIGTGFSDTTGIDGADYKIAVAYNNKTWIRELEQMKPGDREILGNEYITLKSVSDYTGFYEKGKNYDVYLLISMQ